MNRPELDRIIARAEQDLHDMDASLRKTHERYAFAISVGVKAECLYASIKRAQDRRSKCEEELYALIQKRENWGADDA